MGAQLIKNVDIEKDIISTGGHLGIWSMNRGRQQNIEKREVCVFSLEKKRWESRTGKAEDVTSLMRREATSLVRYKHPCVLGIVEPL